MRKYVQALLKRNFKLPLSTRLGFTLIEILVVIGIIAVLAAIVIIAINPARQFAQARNSQRQANIDTILNAVGQNIADNKGLINCPGLTMATTTVYHIGTGSGNANFSTCLVPTYIPSQVPTDPNGGTAIDTQYTIVADTVGRYTVCAPLSSEPALGSPTPVCVTR